MKRYIMIEYDPKRCADGEPLDLFYNLVNTFNDADVTTTIVEFKRKPTRKMLLDEFGGKWP